MFGPARRSRMLNVIDDYKGECLALVADTSLSGASAEVHHNFGSSQMKAKQPDVWVAAKKSGIAGAEGTYGLYAEANREAAAQRGLWPARCN